MKVQALIFNGYRDTRNPVGWETLEAFLKFPTRTGLNGIIFIINVLYGIKHAEQGHGTAGGAPFNLGQPGTLTIWKQFRAKIPTNVLTQFHEYFVINVASKVLTRKILTIYNAQQIKCDHKSSQ
ncbi:hypothetical protein DPMN_069282 [Dreissena polymorpha]|uniref:Uncharacterized protein n=1 Tax=Dreissena polymorpha TaxID=45954 RepID=A0A9D4BUV2_DREPO|nr:hypothetical protein DPMN_069282 [Dreissena polymorpha]